MNNIKTALISYYGEQGCKLKVSIQPDDKKHTFISISIPWDPEDVNFNQITSQPDYSSKGENEDLDEQWRKYNKAEVAMQKEAILLAMTYGLIDAEIAHQAKFSKKYYCSCGCSKGWVLKDCKGRFISIEITSPKKEEQTRQKMVDILSEQETKTLASMMI